MSPTDFHNSVHNAAAGYWSIAVGARAPSSTISAYDFSFTAGLEETSNLVCVDGVNALLVAFDLPPPQPLFEKRPIGCTAAVALILTGARTARSLASISLTPTNDPVTSCSQSDLESLRRSNPATAALPLLELLARKRSGRIVLPRSERTGIAVQLDVLDAQ